MAIWTIKYQSELARGRVLAPERYDPRRGSLKSRTALTSFATLGSIAKTVRKTVNATNGNFGACLVLDTSDAREGLIIGGKRPVERHAIGSAKKVIVPNSVIISRLRPYLRQVAFIDAEIPHLGPSVSLVGSTEFFVLQALDDRSIAFLVPFLLSKVVQGVLAASQEGGHHPRFDEATLLTLPIPEALLDQRDTVSRTIEASVELYRRSENGIAGTVGTVDRMLEKLATPLKDKLEWVDTDASAREGV